MNSIAQVVQGSMKMNYFKTLIMSAKEKMSTQGILDRATIALKNERIKELEEQRDFFHENLISYRKSGERMFNSKEVDKWQRIINLFESVFKINE